MDMKTPIGSKVRKIRELKGIKQETMADSLGISVAAYSKIERDETDVSFSRLERIAEIFQVEMKDIVGFDEKYLFQNFLNNNTAEHCNGVVFAVSENEKALYEQQIKFFKEENEYLKGIIEFFKTNKN